jgi:hypothetical protein
MIEDLAVTNAKIANAAIDTSNIKLGAITTALIDTGAIKTAQIADGSITDAKIVDLTANKINAGTLDVERLIIRSSTEPEKSLIYEINNITGALQSVQGNTINGEVLTNRSITADKIVANAITANEIASKTITANEIASNAVTADKISVNTLSAITADLGEITSGKISGTTISGLRYLLDGNGFLLKDVNNEALITPSGILDTNNINRSDNVANGYPLIIRFYIDDQVNSIDKVFLRLTNENFRAYSTGAASGGGATSGASSSSTTASSSETSRTSGSSSASTTDSGGSSTRTSSKAGSHSSSTSTRWSGDNQTVATGIDAASAAYPGRHTHSFSVPDHSHSVTIQNHSHGMSHTHSFTIPSHSHGMAHTHTIPNHTHGITYGIYENNATNNTVTIYVDGVQRASTSTKDASVNLSSWITTKGWHTVELRSTVLKRISAGLFIKSYIQR